ncbi:MAG: thioredoxin-disulfide reductase [Deltaproteobacteria bacterium]|nr:MAG: thioredoxin-disulfide reductase [Deltaproteobacteria bacterium]RLC15606.1 MAG: thioredoxin-disulfide reductase [Deltaproteobacteria bacterium]HHE73760.1 thioredoxin-disulfide reductase [Desulfobacteraceae bacterium]
MKKADYDLVIIGGGAAGLTAGIYASRARLNTVLIEKSAPGGQILLTDWIENYPGFPEGLAGHALVQQMTDQAKKFGLKIATDDVQSIDYSKTIKEIHLGNKTISTYAVIIATGASFKKLGIPGEERFYGKGISSCATCDAPFYKDRVVVAVGGGDTAVQESLYLTKFAKKVYLVHRRDQLRATKILQERVFCNDKIEILWNHIPTKIDGFFNVENITLKNVKTQEASTLPADGCFVWIGINPNTAFLNNGMTVDESGFLMTDENMETSVPGIFAAGDVRHTPLRQVATAVGDAAVAAISAERYIESITEKDHC